MYRRQDLDTGCIDSDDKGRGRCILGRVDVEQRIIGRDEQTDDEHASDVE